MDYFRRWEQSFRAVLVQASLKASVLSERSVAVFSIMAGYFAAVVINFGDFARFVKNEEEMKKGNLWGLVGNVVFFSFITLMITGGTIAIFGEYIAEPTAMVAKVDNILLTIIAAFAFSLRPSGSTWWLISSLPRTT